MDSDGEEQALTTLICANGPWKQFARDLLGGGYQLKSWGDYWAWERAVEEKVMEAAYAATDAHGRANCPLCDGQATDWGTDRSRMERYDENFTGYRGWSIPKGLEMHLEGGGRTSECRIWKAARRRMELNHRAKFDEVNKCTYKGLAAAALKKVKELCSGAGCQCEIVGMEPPYQDFERPYLKRKFHKMHYSHIMWLDHDRYQISMGTTDYIELAPCTLEQAANALIWEDENPGKRWIQGRGTVSFIQSIDVFKEKQVAAKVAAKAQAEAEAARSKELRREEERLEKERRQKQWQVMRHIGNKCGIDYDRRPVDNNWDGSMRNYKSIYDENK